MPQRFEHLLILDFEATCDRDRPPDPQEIIEFPCVKVNARTMKPEATFHEYVRPVHHPELSFFCSELTGITQSTVDSSNDFEHVFVKFERWLLDQNLPDGSFTFVTCGEWDLAKMLPNQHRLTFGADKPLPEHFTRWINVKKSYHSTMGYFPRSLAIIMRGLCLQFEGRQHSGIDDSMNIVRIVQKLAERGHVFENTSGSNI